MAKKISISFNAPVTLTFVAICIVAMILDVITLGTTNTLIFSVYRSSLLDPFTYIRFIGHSFGHADFSHFFSNMTLLLLLAPLLEEKYGKGRMISIILVTSIVTGLINFIFFPHIALLGASGVVFAFIMLSSITSTNKKTIPLTFILVACIYLGQEFYSMFFINDNISNLTHILGGAVGAIFGFTIKKR